MSKLPVAREGWPFIAIPAAIAAGLALGGRRVLAVPFAAAALAPLGFFRDPERDSPALPGVVLSPADGRVMSVEEIDDPFVGPSVRVATFLSPLDVHINRSPIAGLVVKVTYSRGRFLAAYQPEAGQGSRRRVLKLPGGSSRDTRGHTAGVGARRILPPRP